MNENTGPVNAAHTSSLNQTENASILLKNNTQVLIQAQEHEASATPLMELKRFVTPCHYGISTSND